MARIGIKGQILFGFAIVLLMLVASTGVNVALLSGIKTDVSTFRSALDHKAQAVDMDLVMQKVRVRVNQWLRSMNPDFAKQADDLLAQDATLVAQMATNASSDQERQTVANIDRALKAYTESWHVIQGFYAQEAKLYDVGMVAPGAGIAADLTKIRDDDTIDPATSRLVGAARDAFVTADSAASRYRGSMKKSDADTVAASIDGALTALGKASGPLKASRSADLLAHDVAAINGWRDVFNQAVAIGQARFSRTASWTNNEGEAMAVGANALRTAGQAASDDAQAHVAETISSSGTSLYVLSGLILLVGIGLSLALARSITRPLSRMTATLKALAAGDRTLAIPGTDRRDEIGAMAKAAQIFKDAAIEKSRLEEAAAMAREAAAKDRLQEEQMRAERAAQQTMVVDSLAAALQSLSAGDLTCEMTDAFAPEYERLRSDFNAAIAELRTVIGTIVVNTGALRSGTGEISQAADDLSRRTEQQAASLEQTAAALDEITATVRKTAEGANAAQAIVGTAKTDAQHGEAVVRDAVTAMSAIEQSAKEISQIIGVIDEIAFQTNLLALNAGVEAARAGDAGRGFAVVASEVRALAQRSADAAKQIKGLIGTSTSQVGRGVTLVRETGTALGRILNQVTQVDGVVGEIAASAQEQASGLAQVNTAINQMDQVTQQNAAMVEQSTAASHSLAEDTARLETLTARFKMGPNDAAPVPSVKPSGPPRQPGRAPAPAPARVAKGNAVRTPAVAEESWEEF